ncbi:MAG: hypothetical protein PUE36_08825 [Bacteroidales bacterium]|nr:hypothetical protein [Bacteroidales bacterium]
MDGIKLYLMFHRKAAECKMMRKLCLFLITILVVAACTTDESVIQYPRYVAVTKEYLFRSSEDDRGTTAVEHLYFTIPAGVKEYYIGQGSYVEQRDYGNLTRLEETNYVLESI